MPPPDSSSDPAKQPESLPVALLLAGTGGLLDAATYLLHGHVFAAAMTGNVVLLGLTALTHRWSDTLPHAVPLVAFFAGVLASKLTRQRLDRRAGAVGLSLELAALTLAGFLSPHFPQMAFTAIIAFASAVQVSSFRHVGPYAYNSTFITGDLRDTAEGLYDAMTDPKTRTKSLPHARALGLVCVSFLTGAVVGALAAPHLGNKAYWIAVPVLLSILPPTIRQARQAAASGTAVSDAAAERLN